jgi:hypothetical protein
MHQSIKYRYPDKTPRGPYQLGRPVRLFMHDGIFTATVEGVCADSDILLMLDDGRTAKVPQSWFRIHEGQDHDASR